MEMKTWENAVRRVPTVMQLLLQHDSDHPPIGSMALIGVQTKRDFRTMQSWQIED